MVGERIRAQAIHLLEVRGSDFGSHLAKTAVDLGIPVYSPIYHLALAAFLAVPTVAFTPEFSASDALEAAGLLRDGWSPGDRMRLRSGK